MSHPPFKPQAPGNNFKMFDLLFPGRCLGEVGTAGVGEKKTELVEAAGRATFAEDCLYQGGHWGPGRVLG